MKPSLLEKNLAMVKELHPEKQWAAEMWLAECDRLNYRFRISEAFPTAERQYKLWASHYVYGGPWRTDCDGKKVLSEHQLRLAIDLYPINCTHPQIQAVAAKYGIAHPWPKNDPPHYSVANAKERPEPPALQALSPEADMKRFARGVDRLKGRAKDRATKRFESKYGFSYTKSL